MKSLFWVLGLFGAAVGLVLAARYNTGYVLVVFPQHRLELSINLAALVILAVLVVGYFVLRAVFLAVGMPAEVRRYQERRQREVGRQAFMEGLKAYFEGRYGRAERAAAKAFAAGEAPALSAVIAARAAHEIRAFEARDRHLAAAETCPPDDDYLRHITQAELLLNERRYHDALAVLDRIRDGHTSALRLQLRARQMAKDWDRVLELLPRIEKKRVFDATVVAQFRRTATIESLKRRALDAAQLRAAWDQVGAEFRRDPGVAAAAARGFLALGMPAEVRRIAEQALDAQWDAELVTLYSRAPEGDARDQLQKAEAWLAAHPRDAVLLMALGRLCAHGGLWGKARSYFEASLAVEPSHTAFLDLARLAAQTGRLEESEAHRRAALDLVLARLEEASGGRRRSAF